MLPGTKPPTQHSEHAGDAGDIILDGMAHILAPTVHGLAAPRLILAGQTTQHYRYNTVQSPIDTTFGFAQPRGNVDD